MRFGADAQFYFDIPGLGGLALKGEMVLSKDTNRDFRGAPANVCLDKKGFGYILTGVQNIGDHLGVAVRFDSWDPNRDVDASCSAMGASAANMKAATDSQIDRVMDLGIALLGYGSANIKGTLVYEHLWEQGSNKKDNDIYTAQLQARF